MFSHGGTEVRHKCRKHVAIRQAAAPAGMRQIQINTVSIVFRNGRKIDAHQPTKRVVPRHNVEIRTLNTGRLRQQTVEHAARAWTDTFAKRHVGRLQRFQPSQHEQMARLQLAALQRLGNRLHHRHRGVNLAPLFQPGIPGHANVCQHRHFFTAQAGCAPPSATPQALRIEAFPPRAKKSAQLLAAIVLPRGRCGGFTRGNKAHHLSSMVVPIPV